MVISGPVPTLTHSERTIRFVSMPFVEKTDDNAPGFIYEVFASVQAGHRGSGFRGKDSQAGMGRGTGRSVAAACPA